MSHDAIAVDTVVEENGSGNNYMEFKERNGYLIGVIAVRLCIIASVWTTMSSRSRYVNPNGKNDSPKRLNHITHVTTIE